MLKRNYENNNIQIAVDILGMDSMYLRVTGAWGFII